MKYIPGDAAETGSTSEREAGRDAGIAAAISAARFRAADDKPKRSPHEQFN